MTIQEKIKEIASSRIGITEISGNHGWKDKAYQQRMETLGWQDGWAWCVFAAWDIWNEAYANYDSRIISKLKNLFSPSATETFDNFACEEDEVGFKVDQDPEIGSVVIFRKYKNGKGSWQGHAAIVVDYNEKELITIDGNSNYWGSREGDGFVKKTRELDFSIRDGLVPIGFIHPLNV